jgi:hypothetical protein
VREPFKRCTDSSSFESAGIFRCLFGGRSRKKPVRAAPSTQALRFETFAMRRGLSVAVKRFLASRYAPQRSPAVFDDGRVLRRLPSKFVVVRSVASPPRQVGRFAAS